MTNKRLLTVSEVAARHGVSPRTIQRRITTGDIKPDYHVPGIGSFFLEETVEQWTR